MSASRLRLGPDRESGAVGFPFSGLAGGEGGGGAETCLSRGNPPPPVFLARESPLGVLDRPSDALDKSGGKGGQGAVEFLLFEEHGNVPAHYRVRSQRSQEGFGASRSVGRVRASGIVVG